MTGEQNIYILILRKLLFQIQPNFAQRQRPSSAVQSGSNSRPQIQDGG